MSIARKCDICGKLYESYNDAGMKGDRHNGIRFVTTYNDGSVRGGFIQDCCPECMKTIEDFVDSLKKEKKNEHKI